MKKIPYYAIALLLLNTTPIQAQNTNEDNKMFIVARVCNFTKGGQDCMSLDLAGPILQDEYGSVKEPVFREIRLSRTNCGTIIKAYWNFFQRRAQHFFGEEYKKGVRVTCEQGNK